MRLRFPIPILTVTTFLLCSTSYAQSPELLVRLDDIGMCHSVNVALQTVIDSGLPISASVMVPCPWFPEAVEILKKHPEVSVGIHLTLNAEWRNYRWGPVTGPGAVPSLVDSLGFFFPSRALFFANNPRPPEVETELRAQIHRALQSGLGVDYLDYHMGTAVQTPELRAIVEKLAGEFHLGVSRYFGELDLGDVYHAAPERKINSLLASIDSMQAGPIRLMVFHIGLEGAEMDALEDMNAFGPRNMSKQRHAELSALLSPEFRSSLRQKGVKVVTYRQLIGDRGLASMKRPP